MVASTDIKFYVHTNNNAPQLTNSFGCMLNVLDAALINGIQIGTVLSLTASGSTITAIFGAAHKLMQYQVIKIAGANQAEYNGEHRVLAVPNSTTITFELASAPSVAAATGGINCSLPPLDWEKPFSSTSATGGKGAYRSKNTLLASRPFLRVVDELDPAYTATYAKYAKVGIVETMADIDTMSGVQAPYDSSVPNKNWAGTGSGAAVLNGWAKWYYARGGTFHFGIADTTSPSAGNRNWVLVGNKDWFFIIPAMISGAATYSAIYGFGKFESSLLLDSTNTFLSATFEYGAAQIGNIKASFTPLASTAANTLLLHRNYSQNTRYSTASAISLGVASQIHSGAVNYIAAPATHGNIIFSPICILEGSVLRGTLPQINWLYQSQPYSDMQIFAEGGSIYMAKYTAYDNTTPGQILIKIGEL